MKFLILIFALSFQFTYGQACFEKRDFQNFKKFIQFNQEAAVEQISLVFNESSTRVLNLAFDPDHKKVNPGSIIEAITALELESKAFAQCPFTRGDRGIEYYDCNGRPWDVKTPPSLSFSSMKVAADSITKKIRQPHHGSHVGIILNTTFLSKVDYVELMSYLRVELTSNEKSRFIEICSSFRFF